MNAHKHVKKYSTSLVVRKREIKTTLSYCCANPPESLKLKRMTILNAGKDVEPRTLSYTIGRNVK